MGGSTVVDASVGVCVGAGGVGSGSGLGVGVGLGLGLGLGLDASSVVLARVGDDFSHPHSNREVAKIVSVTTMRLVMNMGQSYRTVMPEKLARHPPSELI